MTISVLKLPYPSTLPWPPAPIGSLRRGTIRPSTRFEIRVEHRREVFAVVHPVLALWILLQACDPVRVELVHDRVDAVTLEPAVAERAGIAERGVRRAFRKPGVL